MTSIEILGTPRAGKTFAINKISINHPSFSIFEERFDLDPYAQTDSFNYNLWYSKYIIKFLESIEKNNNIVILDGGIVNRLIFGKTMFEYGKFNKQQYRKYMDLISPYLRATNFGIIVIINHEESLKQVKSKNNNITRDPKFLKLLNKNYIWISKHFPNYSIIKPTMNSRNLENLLINKINKLIINDKKNKQFAPDKTS